MIYYKLSDMWRQRWMMSIIAMHSWPSETEHYSKQAVIQQAQYVMYLAQKTAGARK